MHWLAALVILANLLFPITLRNTLQESPEITDLGVSHQFGEQITFQVKVQSLADIRELLVYITPEGQPTVWKKIAVDQANSQGEITQIVDARQIALFPFSTVNYRYEASLYDNQTITSETKSFIYDDNRFNWQTLESGIFQIHWYGSDSTMGQEIANIAQQGMQQAQTFLTADPPSPLRIFAYQSSSDLQSALQLTNQPWVAGHAAPELGMVMISISSGPEKKLELERQIPHEIMHLLQYQVMGKSFSKQPVWLIEGMASLAELYPNPEYHRVLEETAKAQQLIAMTSLCSTFPREAGPAFQSYAQSESFVRFIHAKFGSSGLRNLIVQYQNGVGCEEGISAGLGSSLRQLEYRWRLEALGINTGALVWSNLSPYLLIGLLLILPASLSFIPYRARKTSRQPEKSI